MKVQVVKDVWGVEIWPMDIELVYTVVSKLFPRQDVRGDIVEEEPETDIEKHPCWTNAKWNWGRNKPLFTAKQVSKYFPVLMNNNSVGTRFILDLDVSPIAGIYYSEHPNGEY